MAQNQASPFLLRLLALSSTAANRAGRIIKDVMSGGDLGIVEKSVNDLQTEADRSAQRCIIASLSRHYPTLKIIGEEGKSNCEVPSDWLISDPDPVILSKSCPIEYDSIVVDDVVVWVDPLDGTSDYTQGLFEHVTVLIGLAVRGQSVGGVIHQPYYKTVGRTVWGLVGVGVGGVEQPTEQLPANKLIVTTTQSHYSDQVKRCLEAIQPDRVVRVGGAGHKILLLLDGRVHAYVYASGGCKKWDTCGPEGVLMAAGGLLTDIRGQRYRYDVDVAFANCGGVIATVGQVDHAALIAKVPKDIQEALV